MAARPPTKETENQPFTVGSALLGASPGSGMGAYGGVPTIPNPIFSQGAALSGDIGQFPAYSNLAKMYNLANYGTQAQEVAGTPGFSSVLSNLQGQIPQDVKNQLIQAAAERGVSTGTIGSPNADAALLRSLGLTSLDLQNTGQQQYGALLGHFPMAAPFDMQAFMTSPEQYQAAQTAANVNAAAPNPQMAADAELQALKDAIAAGKGSLPGVGGIHGGQTTTPSGLGIGGDMRPSTAPPAVAYGGGAPANTGPTPQSFWDYWAKVGPSQPDPTGGMGGGGGVGAGAGAGAGAAAGAGAGTGMGTGALSGGDAGAAAGMGWGGPTYPGFGPGGSPSQSEWDNFLAALNPRATAVNTWFGLTPEELDLLNSPPDQNAPASDWAQFESDYYNQMLEADPASTPTDTYGYDQGYGDYYDTGEP